MGLRLRVGFNSLECRGPRALGFSLGVGNQGLGFRVQGFGFRGFWLKGSIFPKFKGGGL